MSSNKNKLNKNKLNKKNKNNLKNNNSNIIENKVINLKSRLFKSLKNDFCNHIFFYEKKLDIDSITKLRRNLQLYIKDTSFTSGIYKVKNTINPVILHLNCPGGDIDAGFQIMKFIENLEVDVIICVDGLVASAATFMCLVSKLTVIYPHGHMLIHQPSEFISSKGKFNTIEDKYLRIKQYMKILIKLYKKYTNLDEEQLKKLLSHDIYLDASTCKKYRLVDYIL
jgi:ATP-dependent Clp protease protease subunit